MKAANIRQGADGAKVIKLPPRRVTSMTLDKLLDADLPEPSFAVPGLIQKGLTILAGRPKLGKSWLLLNIMLASTTGTKALGAFDCEQGDALLLSLEDNLGRLKSRFKLLGAKRSCRLDIHTEWPRSPQAVEEIARWHDKHQATALIVGIDTVTRLRPNGTPNRDAYAADAQALEPLQRLAVERDIAIVAVGHTRKAQSDDWLDSVIGTTGSTGTADAILVLKRERGQADAVLYGTGRDLGDFEKPLRFNEQNGQWSVLDMTAAEARAGNTQAAILDVLHRMKCPLTAKQIASAVDRSEPATCNALDRMEADGMVVKIGRNLWGLMKW
jgi:AAA domain-containing protein